ncbi:hypothetical protein LguiA_032197 [Lonicera macranthoides]
MGLMATFEAMEEDRALVLKKLIDAVNEISAISGFKCVVKKQCRDLSRRVKLLMPLFEEFVEMKDDISQEVFEALVLMVEALESAKEFLGISCRGSKIFLVLQPEQMKSKFQELTAHFEQALSGISYYQLNIPNEIKEQVELIHAQFERAKKIINAPYLEQYEEISSIYNQSYDLDTEPDILSMLCKKLEFTNIEDLKEESLALHEMIPDGSGDLKGNIEKMLILLKKIEYFVRTENQKTSIYSFENFSAMTSDRVCTNLSPKLPVAPDDFRCPISLELMRDPVIICTGQTYERTCIRRWLEAGHATCPKTQQNLHSTILTPNYALSSLITHWCESNGLNPPKRCANSCTKLSSSMGVEIGTLLSKLTSGNIEDQRAAAGEVRLLAKNNRNNRLLIAEAGAIPFLVDLCYILDGPTQEHAVTALLNLSLCEDNKRSIIFSGAVPAILCALKHGTLEARENAAATIFSLSVSSEYKLIIGKLGAIPGLVTLLREGTQRGKKDAADALFKLCVLRENKGRAIRADMVPLLTALLTEPSGEMVDEALALMSLLASHPDGKTAIGDVEALPIFVKIIESGLSNNKENAASLLVRLCEGDCQLLLEARELGVMIPLLDLAENGSDRGKRKAAQLLELIGNITEQHEIAQAQASTEVNNNSS